MIEELEDYRAPIPNVRMIRQITVPRWAVDEPNPGEEYVAPEVPDLSEETELLMQGRGRGRFDAIFGWYVDESVSLDSPMPNLSHIESIYNEQGLLVERHEFNEGGLEHRARFAFDADGRLVRRTLENHLDQNLEKEERLYSPQGKLLKAVVNYSDGGQRTTTHTWRENVDDEITIDPEGLESRITRTFDDKGHLLERIEHDYESGTQSGYFWEFDANGNMITVGRIGRDTSRWIFETYEYDAEVRETAWAEFDRAGATLQQRLSTYTDGDCTEYRVIDKNGDTITTQQFNEEHRLLESSTFGPSIESESIFIYDNEGRMIFSAYRALKSEINPPITRLARVPLLRWGYGGYGLGSTTWWEYEFFQK